MDTQSNPYRAATGLFGFATQLPGKSAWEVNLLRVPPKVPELVGFGILDFQVCDRHVHLEIAGEIGEAPKNVLRRSIAGPVQSRCSVLSRGRRWAEPPFPEFREHDRISAESLCL